MKAVEETVGEGVVVAIVGGRLIPVEVGGMLPLCHPPVAEPSVARHGLIAPRGPAALRPEAQRIDRSLHPGWLTGAEGELHPGDGVYCTAGRATVHRVLGKTGNGSRLLELRLPGQPRSSFFAAASNVLLEPCEALPEGCSNDLPGPRVIG